MNFFFLMSPFFLFFGFIFFLMSLFLIGYNFSIFFHWKLILSSFYISFPIYFDYISCVFMSIVLFISGSIIFYSEYYMFSEIYKLRFFFLMFLFVLSMIFLIICPNMICMLLGWDGLGLVSYLLVIYYQNFKSFYSGMITALTNRVGDVFILSSLSLFFSYGSWNYMNFVGSYNLYFSVMFFLASLTKSAQIPFSAWLPSAMAAPTPVSSLVHSSTLVTAGVYILIRFNYFLTSNLKTILMFISLLTMVMSGFSGLMEFDLKKIIALSTLSQLGFMMSTISIGYPNLAFFHLISHAGFKALLFMCAGFFIHSFFDNQDIRFFGLMNKNFCFSLCMFNSANMSLSGFPFLSGFYSKDLILEFVIMNNFGIFFFLFFLLGTFLTILYSFRLLMYLTFKSCFFFSLNVFPKSLSIQNSMYLLFFFSTFLGVIGSSLFFLPYNNVVLPFSLKILIGVLCLSGFLFILKFSLISFFFNSFMVMFFSQMWFLTFLKTDFLKYNFLMFCSFLSNNLVLIIENFFGMSFYNFLYSNFEKIFKYFSFFFYYFSFLFMFWIFLYFFLY